MALLDQWREIERGLPASWGDARLLLTVEDDGDCDRAAFLLGPANPGLGGKPALRFRCAREFGYGASPEMVRRCLERLDESRIRGVVRVLRVLSDTHPVATQGPVWYVGGRSV